MYNIYIIKNKINNKIYIGQTKTSLIKRWSGHKSKSRNDSKLALHSAIRLYGIENFFIELLDTALNLEEANKKEIELINQYNSKCPNGYNMVDGGSVEFLNASLPKTKEHKKKIQFKHMKSAKPIIQFDIATGKILNEWSSGKEILRGGFNRANIIKICKSNKKFGYIYEYGWCYKDFYDSITNKNLLITINYNPHGRTIKCLDMDKNLVKIYHKITDAAKELNCNPSSIADCLNGRAKTCKGYKWEYLLLPETT